MKGRTTGIKITLFSFLDLVFVRPPPLSAPLVRPPSSFLTQLRTPPAFPRACLFVNTAQVSRFFKSVGAADVPEASALFTEVCSELISSEQELEFQQTMNASKGGVKRGAALQDSSDVVLQYEMPIRKENAREALGDDEAAAEAASDSSDADDDADAAADDADAEVDEEDAGDLHQEIADARGNEQATIEVEEGQKDAGVGGELAAAN